MNNDELFSALDMLERERGISAGYLLEKVKNAIVIAVKKDYEVEDENVAVTMDPATGTFEVKLLRDVVDEVTNPNTQILEEDAKKIKKKLKVGDQLETKLKTKDFGRIAAQTAKHVIRQGIREAERSQMYTEMQSKSHEIVTGVVTRVDNARGIVALEIGKNEAILPRNEQVPGEVLTEGEHVKVYVVDVAVTDRGPRVMISRTHPGLVKRMFEMEVPEVFDGTVEIKAIAREAGQRTKLAVWSKDPDVDPRGACIGAHGSRVANIVEELNGEKIDVVLWSEDPAEFIAAALSPANVVSVEILEGENKSCRVTVPDNQLSLAIGNKGQNARLCARLTGYNIDIRPESGYYGEDDQQEQANAEADEEA
ncbi:transcription termination factor NusA [Ruminococcaceae bacterium OttesenSCG-928-A16]|nr:transcription termination factor NusA [Ruminococcaceae bacterium OttesenSCG-928-A16]